MYDRTAQAEEQPLLDESLVDEIAQGNYMCDTRTLRREHLMITKHEWCGVRGAHSA